MTTLIIQRLLWALPLLFVVSFLVFAIVLVAPGDPARLVAGDQADGATVEAVRRSLGLDRPLHEQYIAFMGRLIRGDLGRSIHTRQPVLGEIMTRYWATAKLSIVSLVFAVLIGIALGVIAAAKPYSVFDYASMFIALIGISMPAFWLGLVLMYVFSLQLQLLPTAGYGGWQYYVLPAVTLGTRSLAVVARLTRSEMLSVLSEDFIRTARSKGLGSFAILSKHALKNALISVVTVIGVQMGVLLAGSVVVEVIFNWPGLGRHLIFAILGRDFPVIQGGILLVAVTFVLINLLVDVLYGLLDPRIKYA